MQLTSVNKEHALVRYNGGKKHHEGTIKRRKTIKDYPYKPIGQLINFQT